ncbi:short chain dehydrogenase domain-containing protein [Rhizoctonia solani AG-1 IA]|uniref:Short chain dehydrogenase domain-containing protein n=1 Tax=Thanatephorus cucumeris (strain AG1-IA) TaxID=983506 RepID=L8X4T3_THACA|nr:short chain dehydrogenase domain-containing protein [Rhizoctonia solani AG-1 IA]
MDPILSICTRVSGQVQRASSPVRRLSLSQTRALESGGIVLRQRRPFCQSKQPRLLAKNHATKATEWDRLNIMSVITATSAAALAIEATNGRTHIYWLVTAFYSIAFGLSLEGVILITYMTIAAGGSSDEGITRLARGILVSEKHPAVRPTAFVMALPAIMTTYSSFSLLLGLVTMVVSGPGEGVDTMSVMYSRATMIPVGLGFFFLCIAIVLCEIGYWIETLGRKKYRNNLPKGTDGCVEPGVQMAAHSKDCCPDRIAAESASRRELLEKVRLFKSNDRDKVRIFHVTVVWAPVDRRGSHHGGASVGHAAPLSVPSNSCENLGRSWRSFPSATHVESTVRLEADVDVPAALNDSMDRDITDDGIPWGDVTCALLVRNQEKTEQGLAFIASELPRFFSAPHCIDMPYPQDAHSEFVGSLLSSFSFARTNFDYLLIPFSPLLTLTHLPDLHGHVAIVTGANSGVGFETARSLAGMGARVILACRSESKGKVAQMKIVESTGNKEIEIEVLDLASFSSIKQFLGRWESRQTKHVDILVNNAGCMTNAASVTEDGFEYMYQTNHLGHVLLTLSLLNHGRLSSHGRIINVSSCSSYASDELDAHNADSRDIIRKYTPNTGCPLSFGDVMTLYARSKASQVVWTMALQRHLAEREGWKNISVHTCHPGTVKSSIWTQPDGIGSMAGRLADIFRMVGNTFGIPNEQGAVNSVWLATDPEPARPDMRGLYWDRLRWKWVRPWILDPKRQSELWDKWCEDVGVTLC